MKQRMRAWLGVSTGLFALVLLLNTFVPVNAQQYFGTIVGTVSDASGAAIPNATITVTNTQTGIARQVTTDQSGNYTVGSLIPATYSIKAEVKGFETTEVPSVDLPVARTVTINLNMKLGTVTQTVEVQATAPLLDTTNATVGTVINNQAVVDMPLNGRNYTDLLLLVPGSVGNGSIFMASGGQNYSVSGNRSEQNNFTLDGVANNEEFFKQFAIQPSIDAIKEFKVQTNITSAEFGQAAGANVAVATKSGTNQLHGDLYEFVRNDKFDAADFFGNYHNTPKSAYRRNQFGVTGGGPIYIPHIYNGHDKAFWFFNYEGVRIRRASSNVGTIPATSQLQGDLTDQPPIYDPATTRQVGVDAKGNPIYTRDRMQCNGVLNMICPDRIDPIVAAYAGIWYPKTNQLGSGNIIVTSPFQLNQYQYNGRTDYKIRDNLQFFGRFTQQHAHQISPYGLPTNNNNLINDFVNAEASFTWLVSPTTVVDLRSAYLRTNLEIADNNPAPGAAAFLQSYPIQGTPIKSANVPLYPWFILSGYTYPQQNGFPFPTNKWQELGNISMVRGKHTIKIGFEVVHMANLDDGLFTSQFSFDSVPTADPQNVGNTGSALASYLLGLPSSGLRNLGTTAAYMRQTTQAYYAQDDWKLTPKLTVNLGLRYEYDQWPREKYNHLSMYDFGAHQFVWAGTNPLTGQRANIRPQIVDPDFNNFAPRLGLAYQVDPKTTVRSGFGVFYAANYLWEIQGVRGSWPYAISETFSAQNATLPDRPLATFMPSYISPVPGTPPNSEHTVGRTDRTTYSMQWNLGVQRELTKDLLLEVDYIGNGGRKLPIFTNMNDPQPGPGVVGSPQHPRPEQAYAPTLAAVSQITNLAISDYSALQVKVEKKFSAGLQFLASYSWGHYIDLGGSGFSQSAAPQNDYNYHADRADGTFDFRHIFTGNWVYDLPAGRGRKFLNQSNKFVDAVLGGWEWTGIAHFNTGGPLNVSITFDNANVGQRSLAQRPDYVGGPQRTTPTGGDVTKGYLNASAFAVPPPFTFGNLGRNTARNLGMENWDMGLYKNFPIRENRESVQFRAEFFNIFNHVNLGGIDSGVGDPAFGQITSTQNTSREIQFALKFYF